MPGGAENVSRLSETPASTGINETVSVENDATGADES